MEVKNFITMTVTLVIGVILVAGVLTPVIADSIDNGGGSDKPSFVNKGILYYEETTEDTDVDIEFIYHSATEKLTITCDGDPVFDEVFDAGSLLPILLIKNEEDSSGDIALFIERYTDEYGDTVVYFGQFYPAIDGEDSCYPDETVIVTFDLIYTISVVDGYVSYDLDGSSFEGNVTYNLATDGSWTYCMNPKVTEGMQFAPICSQSVVEEHYSAGTFLFDWMTVSETLSETDLYAWGYDVNNPVDEFNYDVQRISMISSKSGSIYTLGDIEASVRYTNVNDESDFFDLSFSLAGYLVPVSDKIESGPTVYKNKGLPWKSVTENGSEDVFIQFTTDKDGNWNRQMDFYHGSSNSHEDAPFFSYVYPVSGNSHDTVLAIGDDLIITMSTPGVDGVAEISISTKGQKIGYSDYMGYHIRGDTISFDSVHPNTAPLEFSGVNAYIGENGEMSEIAYGQIHVKDDSEIMVWTQYDIEFDGSYPSYQCVMKGTVDEMDAVVYAPQWAGYDYNPDLIVSDAEVTIDYSKDNGICNLEGIAFSVDISDPSSGDMMSAEVTSDVPPEEYIRVLWFVPSSVSEDEGGSGGGSVPTSLATLLTVIPILVIAGLVIMTVTYFRRS